MGFLSNSCPGFSSDTFYARLCPGKHSVFHYIFRHTAIIVITCAFYFEISHAGCTSIIFLLWLLALPSSFVSIKPFSHSSKGSQTASQLLWTGSGLTLNYLLHYRLLLPVYLARFSPGVRVDTQTPGSSLTSCLSTLWNSEQSRAEWTAELCGATRPKEKTELFFREVCRSGKKVFLCVCEFRILKVCWSNGYSGAGAEICSVW